MSLDKHLYKEVYVIGADHTTTESGELTVHDTFEHLLESLRLKNISVCPDLRVIHGVLTPALAIPRDLRGRTVFLIIEDPDTADRGILLDSDSEGYEELGAEIEKTLAGAETASFFAGIEHVYILYGYELNICMSVDEDELDEDIIAKCMKVSEVAERQLKQAEED